MRRSSRRMKSDEALGTEVGRGERVDREDARKDAVGDGADGVGEREVLVERDPVDRDAVLLEARRVLGAGSSHRDDAGDDDARDGRDREAEEAAPLAVVREDGRDAGDEDGPADGAVGARVERRDR